VDFGDGVGGDEGLEVGLDVFGCGEFEGLGGEGEDVGHLGEASM